MSTLRLWVTLLLILSTAGLAHAARSGTAPAPTNLSALPYRLTTWTGRDGAVLDADTVRVLAADAYLNRRYTGESSAPVDLYIAYYARQQPGVSIHSPLHCLPGTGWEPQDIATIDVARGDGTTGHIRRLLVHKDFSRAVVLYWYSIHGRMLGNEVASRLWLLRDSVRLGRSDAALVRIVIPVSDDRPAPVDSAEREGMAFVRDVLPFLAALWS